MAVPGWVSHLVLQDEGETEMTYNITDIGTFDQQAAGQCPSPFNIFRRPTIGIFTLVYLLL